MNPLMEFKDYLPLATAMLRRFEGLRLKPYRDPGGVWTLGYGHKMAETDWNTTHTSITRIEAEELLYHDIQLRVGYVDQRVKRELTEAQRSALVVFVFNIGRTAFRNSTLLKCVNAGQDGLVPREMLRWVWDNGRVLPGLVTRRLAVADLYWRGRLPT